MDLADDVLLAAKEIAKREHKTTGQVLSELARQALTQSLQEESEEPEFFGFRPFKASGKIVTNALIDELREDDAY